MHAPGEITRYLLAAKSGDRGALDAVFSRVYGEVQRIAAAQLRRLGGEQTLSTTAIVHEAYLKLAGSAPIPWQDRSHFYAVAARAMRQVLLNRARGHRAQKRGGARPAPLDSQQVALETAAAHTLELDGALERLAALDERLARVVELRYFAGLSTDETAAVLGVTDRTIKRDWQTARAFLYRELRGDEA